jgi:subtilase family serine protease
MLKSESSKLAELENIEAGLMQTGILPEREYTELNKILKNEIEEQQNKNKVLELISKQSNIINKILIFLIVGIIIFTIIFLLKKYVFY